MLTASQLFPASFRGVPFLMRLDDKTIGKKFVKHEYPNQNTRFIEELGVLPDDFSVTATITAESASPNYFTNRDNLEAALLQEGSGQLVHPFYGTIQVTATTTRLTQNNVLNDATFFIQFSRSDGPIFPKFSGNNTSLIRRLQTQIIELVRIDVIEQYDLTRNIRNNYQDAVALLGTINSIFEDITTLFTSDPVSNSRLLREVNRFADNISSIAGSSDEVSEGVLSQFELAGDLVDDGQEGIDLFDTFFRFGEDDIPFPLDTAQRIERQNNRDILNSTVNALALVYAYINAILVDYETDEQLNVIRQLLDEQASYLLRNNTLSDATVELIKTMRSEVGKFFRKEIVGVDNIRTITIYDPTPITTLCYRLYGSLDNIVPLINLNNIVNPTFVSGDIRVLSNAN